MTKGVPHDVMARRKMTMTDEDSPSSTRLNVRGKHELRAFDGKTLKPVEIRASRTVP